MVYFFYGGEDFLLWNEVNLLKKKLLEKDERLEIHSFNCEEGIQLKDLFEKIGGSNNLFSYKKLIFIKDIFALGKNDHDLFIKNFKKFFSSVGENTIIITGLVVGKKRFKKGLLDFLAKKEAEQKEFKKIQDYEVADWIVKEFSKRSNNKIKIEKEIAFEIGRHCQNNLWIINNEIDKIINYHPRGKINKELINKIIFGDQDFKIFDFVDAIGFKNKKRALEILQGMFKKGENTHYLLSMVLFQIRNLAKLSTFRNSSESHVNISKKTKLHPFVIKKTLSQLNFFSDKDISKVYKTIADIDYSSKTGQSIIENDLVSLVVSL